LNSYVKLENVAFTFTSNEHLDCDLLECDTMQYHEWLSTLQRKMLLPTWRQVESECSWYFRNVHNHSCGYTVM